MEVKLERQSYDVAEVAAILGISRNHAYEMANRRAFPVIRLGRRLVIPRASFDAWFNTAAAVERPLDASAATEAAPTE